MALPARYVTRSSLGWPATEAGSAKTNLGLVAHYDSKNGRVYEADHKTPKPHNACVTYWKATRRMHISSNKWLDVGYAYFVCPHDYIFAGREVNHVQAAELPTKGKLQNGNIRYVAVTFATGPDETPNATQLQAWRRLRAWLRASYGVGSKVYGHRDFTATDCPGNKIYKMVGDGTLAKSPSSTPTPKPTTPTQSLEEVDLSKLPVLGKGDSGVDVLSVRALLFERYLSSRWSKDSSTLYAWLRNEKFDDDLVTDVKSYQKWLQIGSDGIVGPITWRNLVRAK